MRILHVSPRYPPAHGGTENHVRAIARELAARGHVVTVATSSTAGRVGEEQDGDVRVVRFAARRFKGDYLFPPWLPMPGLGDFLRRTEADVLHAHAYRFSAVEEAARARRGRPFVVTAHGFYPPENPLVAASRFVYDRTSGGRAMRAADRVVAVTAHEVGEYARLGVPRDRVRTVPNGLPEAELSDVRPKEEAKAKLGIDGDLVLFLGRLGHDKGLRTLLAAGRRILDRRPGARIAVVGPDGGTRAGLERLARALRLERSLLLPGAVADPGLWFSACDVFVLPSRYEAFGIVLLEAMARGRPVVASAVGGIPFVVEDGRTGTLVPHGDAEALAAATLRYLGDPDLARRHGEEGRRVVAERFTWPRVVDQLEKLYAEIVR
ncbi:MAG TPA: glycosyltransferase family 4 protein [Candidatus Thermoplasmatota archaeon]|nr:glycosyltransferase family 4 protein [Candidatus Thermoplasmatota archaeon]